MRVLLQGLMKLLQAGERPEAPQPAGLTVQLHPYQRQSLRFMLDNERGEGGHRRHFWVPFRTPSGFAFWYSPVFLRACVDVPPAPWGGILAEEMVGFFPLKTLLLGSALIRCLAAIFGVGATHDLLFLSFYARGDAFAPAVFTLRHVWVPAQGCGKTVEVLALILANPAPPDIVAGAQTPDGYIQSRCPHRLAIRDDEDMGISSQVASMVPKRSIV